MTADLEARIKDILGKLAILSEAPTSNLDPATSHGVSESSPPAGVQTVVNLHRETPDRPPNKDRSLHDWFAWQFARARDDRHLRILLLLAENEHEDRVVYREHSRRLRAGELDQRDARDGGLAEREAAKRVIDLYEGREAIEVAIYERTTEAWVLKVRRMAKRNPTDGTPRSDFLDLDEDERREVIAKLSDAGWGQKAIAHRLQVSRAMIRKYWGRDSLLAAA